MMKKAICIFLCLAMILSLAACGGGSSASAPAAGTSAGSAPAGSEAQPSASGDPIKIGFLLPKSGGYAPMGALAQAAIEMALEDYDNQINGRPIQVCIEDTQSDASVAVQMAQKLIEKEGCTVICGPESGSCALAVKEYAPNAPDVTFILNGGSEDETMRTVYDNVYRCSITGAQSCWGLGEYAVKELGWKKFVTIAPDNDFQYSQIAGFVTTTTLAGGEIVDRMWFPEVGNDFSSLIAQIPTDIDAIFLAAGGSNGADFLKQYKEYGLTIPILGGHSVVDELTIHTPEIGAVIEGTYGTTTVAHDIGTEAFNTFNERHIEKVGYPASIMTLEPYLAISVALNALEKVGGDLADVEALRAALNETDLDTPTGKFHFDDYRQGLFTVYITQVTKAEDGSFYNKKLGVFENQGQFGPFDPDWYQSQPSPDRTNPTIEAIQSAKYAA